MKSKGNGLLNQIAGSKVTPAFVRNAAYQHALRSILDRSDTQRVPNELFSRVSDEFWFWMNTDGRRKNQWLTKLVPAMPEEDVQLAFTGATGNSVLREAFAAYKLFKQCYERRVGPISRSRGILDFGCGWGRIIRFFLRDVEPSKLWGCDPVEQMIAICTSDNPWCNFRTINTRPPSPFQDESFDLIYSFSVFSHLSEEMHKVVLAELARLLRPGGILMVTTRRRSFIDHCAKLRKRTNLDSMHAGPRSSASAFLDTRASLSDYDDGKYCFSQLVHEGEWPYWGEAAISKEYVLNHWTNGLSFLDYIDDPKQCTQNVIAMRK